MSVIAPIRARRVERWNYQPMSRRRQTHWVYEHLPWTADCPYVKGLDRARNLLWRQSLGLAPYIIPNDPDERHPDYAAGWKEGLARGPASLGTERIRPVIAYKYTTSA